MRAYWIFKVYWWYLQICDSCSSSSMSEEVNTQRSTFCYRVFHKSPFATWTSGPSPAHQTVPLNHLGLLFVSLLLVLFGKSLLKIQLKLDSLEKVGTSAAGLWRPGREQDYVLGKQIQQMISPAGYRHLRFGDGWSSHGERFGKQEKHLTDGSNAALVRW